MSEALIIAVPAAVGVSLAMPEEYNPAISLLLAILAAISGMYGLYLTRQDQAEAALNAHMASTLFGLLSTVKSLALI